VSGLRPDMLDSGRQRTSIHGSGLREMNLGEEVREMNLGEEVRGSVELRVTGEPGMLEW